MKTTCPVKRPRPRVSERASDLIEGNYYVTIGLTRRQRTLLSKAARGWGFHKQPCATATRLLVMLSLANLPLIEEWWRVHYDHCEKEGLWFAGYLDRLARRSLGEPITP